MRVQRVNLSISSRHGAICTIAIVKNMTEQEERHLEEKGGHERVAKRHLEDVRLDGGVDDFTETRRKDATLDDAGRLLAVLREVARRRRRPVHQNQLLRLDLRQNLLHRLAVRTTLEVDERHLAHYLKHKRLLQQLLTSMYDDGVPRAC